LLNNKELPGPALRAEVGSRMRRARENLNITPHQAALQFRVSDAALHDWEAGRKLPSLERLREAAAFYRISADGLLAMHSEEQFQEDLHLSAYRRLDPGQRLSIEQMTEALRRA
jgi:transcriptional regulator with XRE-family HTH domain